MGIFDTLDSALGITDYVTSGSPSPYDIYGLGQPMGFYQQSFGLAALFEALGGEIATGKGGDLVPGTNMTYKQLFKSDKSAVVKKGKNTYALVPTQDQLQQQAQAYQSKQFESMKQTAGELFGPNGPPAFQQLEALASGTASIYGELENIAADFTNKTIAASSFAADPNVQKFKTAPIAQQLALTKEGLKQQAQSQQLGILGVPGFGPGFSFSPQYTTAPQPSAFTGLGQGGMQLGFNALSQFNTAGLGAGFLASLINSAATAQAGQ